MIFLHLHIPNTCTRHIIKHEAESIEKCIRIRTFRTLYKYLLRILFYQWFNLAATYEWKVKKKERENNVASVFGTYVLERKE